MKAFKGSPVSHTKKKVPPVKFIGNAGDEADELIGAHP